MKHFRMHRLGQSVKIQLGKQYAWSSDTPRSDGKPCTGCSLPTTPTDTGVTVPSSEDAHPVSEACFKVSAGEPAVPFTANRLRRDRVLDLVLGRDRQINPDCWPPDCNYECR